MNGCDRRPRRSPERDERPVRPSAGDGTGGTVAAARGEQSGDGSRAAGDARVAGRRSSGSAQAPRDVARRLHRRRRLRARAGPARRLKLVATLSAMAAGAGRLRRAQHVVGRRYRRDDGAHRDAADPARLRPAARGAGDRRPPVGRLGDRARRFRSNLARGVAACADHRHLHPALHDGAEAPDAAQHRDRRGRRRAAAGDRLGARRPARSASARSRSSSSSSSGRRRISGRWRSAARRTTSASAFRCCRTSPVRSETCRQILVYSFAARRLDFRRAGDPGRRVALWRRSRPSATRSSSGARVALYRLRIGEESPRRKAAMALFGYSILYMFLLFATLLAEVFVR